MTGTCPYAWSTHGCDLPVGHEGDHQCLFHGADGRGVICDSRPRGHTDVFDFTTNEPEAVAP